jgi:hypothetical protein
MSSDSMEDCLLDRVRRRLHLLFKFPPLTGSRLVASIPRLGGLE